MAVFISQILVCQYQFQLWLTAAYCTVKRRAQWYLQKHRLCKKGLVTVMAVAARKCVQAVSAVPKVMTRVLWGEKGPGETTLIVCP